MTQDKPLSERWEANKDRPAWVQANREELQAATGVDIPRARSQIAGSPGKKGAITKKLTEEDNEDDNE